MAYNSWSLHSIAGIVLAAVRAVIFAVYDGIVRTALWFFDLALPALYRDYRPKLGVSAAPREIGRLEHRAFHDRLVERTHRRQRAPLALSIA